MVVREICLHNHPLAYWKVVYNGRVFIYLICSFPAVGTAGMDFWRSVHYIHSPISDLFDFVLSEAGVTSL